MRTAVIGCVAIATLILPGLAMAQNENEDWLNKHAVIKTTETSQRDANGNIQSIKVVKDTTIYIKQTVTETRKPDPKTGVIRTMGRTTVSTDTLGGSATIIEAPVAGSSGLVTTSITTIERTADGTLTTVYARDKSGAMSVVSRTTAVIKNNGIAPTVVAQ